MRTEEGERSPSAKRIYLAKPYYTEDITRPCTKAPPHYEIIKNKPCYVFPKLSTAFPILPTSLFNLSF